METNGEHSWLRKRLAAYRSGVLSEQEEARFLRHLESCSECRGALAAFAEEAAPIETIEGHLPTGIVARWEEAHQLLRGLERRLVRQHLAECASCRQDLELIGFQPELPFDPKLEADEEHMPSLAEEPPVTPPPRSETVRIATTLRPDPAARRLRWILGSWAVAATAVAVLAGLWPSLHSAGGRLEVSPAATRVLVTVRGEGTNVVEVTPRTLVIVLGVPALQEIARGSTATIRVHTDDGAVLLDDLLPVDDFAPRTGLALTNRRGTWEPGKYRLSVSAPTERSAKPAEWEYTFEVRLR